MVTTSRTFLWGISSSLPRAPRAMFTVCGVSPVSLQHSKTSSKMPLTTTESPRSASFNSLSRSLSLSLLSKTARVSV